MGGPFNPISLRWPIQARCWLEWAAKAFPNTNVRVGRTHSSAPRAWECLRRDMSASKCVNTELVSNVEERRFQRRVRANTLTRASAPERTDRNSV